ncbi:zinc-dependent metalloprotease [Halomarina ordinaria]|uniref:Zinc-dependent metalloprotease n=1 Tax=Halomarina ordinaria TaxID=3033939 RepID=A0ABD5U3Z0_9EURY|nr:zinc-dependent metalloprotease [Halomarina sp. PSRA2]
MNFYRAVRAVTDASGEGPVDWVAVGDAAKAVTAPGDLDLSATDRQAYAADVRAARDRIRAEAGVDFDLPATVEVQNRHHWVDANVATFERILDLLDADQGFIPGIARTVNTGSMAFAIGFLANNVLGQYDPRLLSGSDDHALYFVHPNISRVARQLDADEDRFRRWIAFHEVTHAAEFGAAPWLSDHLEGLIESTLRDLSAARFDRDDFRAIDTTMTAVEGYAELLMDRTFDDEYADLRAKLDARRQGGGPIAQLFRRLLGLGRKRRQYERGKDFFEAVVSARDLQTASLVWERPENLPSDDELGNPTAWLTRVA